MRKKETPYDGLLLDVKDRKLKAQCQECGVPFYIGHEETSQQTSERRVTLRRSINAAKKKMRRLEEKGDVREQVRLQKQAVRQELHRQALTNEAREARLQDDRVNKERSQGLVKIQVKKIAHRGQDLILMCTLHQAGVVVWW